MILLVATFFAQWKDYQSAVVAIMDIFHRVNSLGGTRNQRQILLNKI
jgi:hypothetical protein